MRAAKQTAQCRLHGSIAAEPDSEGAQTGRAIKLEIRQRIRQVDPDGHDRPPGEQVSELDNGPAGDQRDPDDQ